MQQSDTAQESKDEVIKLLADRTWRLNNLYYIKDVKGNKVLFRMNWAQRRLYESMHYYNVILKARQLGFSTFIMIYLLDACLFNQMHAAGVIAHTREAAEDLFRNKIRFAYENLPDWLREAISAKSDNARVLEFNNGSSIVVGTSLRSGSFQKLHISEYGKTSVREPEKALEIKTGALNTVHVGQQIFIESTAEGQAGEFFDIVQTARAIEDTGRELTAVDPKFHFFSWFDHPDYKLSDTDTGNVSVPEKLGTYFDDLAKLGVVLSAGQKAWYIKKYEQQGEAMLREFPSTPDEAFQGSMEGAYFTGEIRRMRDSKRICRVPYELTRPVHTFWDLGNKDSTVVWFFQHIGMEYRFIDYWEGADVGGLPHFVKVLRDKGYIYGRHYWPHDGAHRQISTGKLLKEMGEDLGIRPIKIVPRTKIKQVSIEKCRPVLERAYFDGEKCYIGIKHLENYRKSWNDKLGIWDNKPQHDEASHCADGFMTFVDGYEGRGNEFIDYNSRMQYADTEYDMLGG